MSATATLTTESALPKTFAKLHLRGDGPVPASKDTTFSSDAKDVQKILSATTLLSDDADPRAARAKYPQYLPVWEHSRFPAWEEIPYVDAGTRGTSDKRHLITEGVTRKAITPPFGEEIRVSLCFACKCPCACR